MKQLESFVGTCSRESYLETFQGSTYHLFIVCDVPFSPLDLADSGNSKWMSSTGSFLLSNTTFYSTLLMVHQSNLVVEFFFVPYYLIYCLRALKIHFNMKSSKSYFLSEGAKDRKVKKMKCTFVCLERLCALKYLGLIISV